MSITAKTKLCMVIGDPVEHSLSPAIHNAGYKAAGLADEFVYVAAQVAAGEIETFINGVKAMGIRGVSCTMPHKQSIMPYLDALDPVAAQIGAVNTVVNTNGILTGYNTDWAGIVQPLQQITELAGKQVAIIGAGGSARAAAYGLVNAGATVTCYNRTLKNAQQLAQAFGCKAKPLSALAEITAADIIIQTAPAGSNVVAPELLRPHHIVFDIVYSASNMALLDAAKAVGAKTLDGLDMLLHQGTLQFELYTGKPAPQAAMQNAIREKKL